MGECSGVQMCKELKKKSAPWGRDLLKHEMHLLELSVALVSTGKRIYLGMLKFQLLCAYLGL